MADLFMPVLHNIQMIQPGHDVAIFRFLPVQLDLYEAGLISYEDALRNADSLNDLRLKIKLHGQESKDRDIMSGLDHLDIV